MTNPKMTACMSHMGKLEPFLKATAEYSPPGTVKLECSDTVYVNGAFIAPGSTNTFTVVNPATEAVEHTLHETSTHNADEACIAAKNALPMWMMTDPCKRRDLMLRLADLITMHKDKLAEEESKYAGKPLNDCKVTEIPLVAEIFRYYAGWADKITGKDMQMNGGGQYTCVTKKEPVGVVGAIIPWNYPLLMAAWKLAPALACGCTVVVKSSEKTPVTAMHLARLIHEAGFPAGVVNIMTGPGSLGQYLAKHQHVDKVAFTGSTAVGQEIGAACAKDVKRCSLELGGKSPLIVFEDADIKKAVEIAQHGAYANMGQCCIAATRTFVHKSIYKKFVEALVERVKCIKTCYPTEAGCNHGPLIDKVQYDKVIAFIKAGKEEGAQCVYGGVTTKEGPGFYVTPTIFAEVTDNMRIAREEIFGPVISVLSFSTVEEVIKRANNTCYGLGAGVCTNDRYKQQLCQNSLKAGTVYINCYNVVAANTPFGGYKHSGIHRELGEAGLEAYLETKTIITDVYAH